MEYRRLGQTGITVSEIGFGAWGIGGSKNGDVAYGPSDERESIAALRRAYELGITFYDTSNFYGFGHSEKIIGRALGDVRRQVVIATKFGLLDSDGRYDFSAKHIRESIDASLRRLGTDYADLYQLHSPPIDDLKWEPEVLPTLRSLQQEGKILAYGISVRSPADGLTAVNRYHCPSIQVNFNMLDMRAVENGLFDACVREDVGVISRTPLCSGMLTGDYSAESRFHRLDHRGKVSKEQIGRWAGAFQQFAPALVAVDGQTQAQTALRFCLSYPCVSTVIPGMMRRAHVAENAAASDLGPLLESERLAFEQEYAANTFFLGSAT